jgi:hypothetical protein
MIPKITQITAVTGNEGQATQVYGLSEDNKIYLWDSGVHNWYLFAS